MRKLPLNNVFNYIPPSIREYQDDDDQFLSWALQCLRTVESHERYTYAFEVLEVEDHKASLPRGYHRIERISYLPHPPLSDDHIDDIQQTLPEAEDGQRISHTEVAPQLYYQLFVNSRYYRDTHCRMKYVGTTSRNFFTSDCYQEMMRGRDRCQTSFSITEDGCMMTLDEPTGFVCMLYSTEVKSKEGFLIPEQPVQLWQGLAHYCISQYWLNRIGFGDPNAANLYQQFQYSSHNYMREAKSIFRMQNISYENLLHTVYHEQYICRLPAVFNFKTTG